MKMTPKTYRIVAKFWPLICGLIIGGLLGGIMQSFAAFLLFGAIGCAYFHFDFFHVPAGSRYAESCQGDEYDNYADELQETMNRKDDEESMAAADIEPYASIYGYHHH